MNRINSPKPIELRQDNPCANRSKPIAQKEVGRIDKITPDLIKDLNSEDFSKKLSIGKKKGFMSGLDYLSPGRKKIAQLGWLGIWGGLGASAVLSLFQGFKKGFSEPISNTISSIGVVLQETADYKNSLIRKLFRSIKTRLPRRTSAPRNGNH